MLYLIYYRYYNLFDKIYMLGENIYIIYYIVFVE